MSGAMQKLRGTARVVFDGVNGDVKKTQHQLDLTGRNIVTLERYMKMLERRRKISIDDTEIQNLNRKLQMVEGRIGNIKNMGRTVSPKLSDGGGSGLFNMGFGKLGGIAAGLGLATMLSSGVSASTQAGLQGQAQRASFETIAGKEQGGALYGNVTKYAQQSIYGNELYGQAQTQLAFGAQAQEVMPTLKMLGDVAMGDKQRMESLNLAYSQVRAAGKLTGQDLLQFVNAGFNPLQEIAAKTGKTLADLRTEVSDGKITFEHVRGAFKSATEQGGKFYKMVDTIAKTDYGKVEAAKGQLQGLGLQLGASLAPLVGKFVEQIGTPGMDFFGKEIVPKLGDFLEGLSDYLPIIKELAATTFQTVKPILGLLASNDLKELLKETGQLAISMGKDLQPVVEDLAVALGLVVKVIKPLLELVNIGSWSISNDTNFEGAANGTKAFFAQQKQEKANAFNAINAGVSGRNPYVNVAAMLDPRKKQYAGQAFPTLVNANAAGAPAPNTLGAAAAALAGGGGSASGGAGTITGGGTKTVNVYFNKEIVAANGITIQVNGDAADGAREAKKQLEQELKMLGYSIGNSINE